MIRLMMLLASVAVSSVAASELENRCGPNAVGTILSEYGIAYDEDELLRDTQYDEERGSSMRALEQTLNQHGIETYAANVPSTSSIHWPHPVLVHLPNKIGLDHFAVLLDSPDGNASQSLVMAPGFLASFNTSGISRLRSSTVVFTSPNPIKKSDILQHVSRSLMFNVSTLVLGALFLFQIFILKGTYHVFSFYRRCFW